MTDWNLKLQAFLYSDRSEHDDLPWSYIKELYDSISSDENKQDVENANRTSFAMSGHGTEIEKAGQLRHPFSYEEFYISLPYIEKNLNKIKQSLKENATETTFLTLWRHLPSVSELASDGTVFQNPCFWDIRSMASAIAATHPGRAYLYFTVAGVHDFISASRRTQDLWAGSYLLSYLMWKAMQPIVEELGPDVIIQPNLLEQPLVDVWLKEGKGVQVDYPGMDALKVANFPNFYFALIHSEKAKKLADESKQCFVKSWEKIYCKVKNWVETEAENKITFDDCWNEIWERQKKDVFEIYWAYCDWGDDPENVRKDFEKFSHDAFEDSDFIKRFENEKTENPDKWGLVYPHLSKLTGQVVTQRKNLRDFYPVDEPGEKCTLCGIREAVHTSKQKSISQLKKFWEDFREELGIRLKKGEMLCGVCLTKRLAAEAYFKEEFKNYEFDSFFPSTGSIASASFKMDIIRYPELNRPAETFAKAIKALNKELKIPPGSPSLPRLEIIKNDDFTHVDGQWLYEESFSKKRLEKEYFEGFNEKLMEDALLALKKLRTDAKNIDIKMPSKYYALLYMDGDSMSKWVNGKNLPFLKDAAPEVFNESKEKRPLSPGLHRSLSTALRNYALRVVRNVVEERHTGKLVYAGGDDVVAFVPVDDLLDTLQELRILFSGGAYSKNGIESQKGFVKMDNRWSMLMGNCATASIGVVISHYRHPLYRTVDEVNDALFKRAKEDLDRDSFAVTVIEKSGGVLKTGAKWEYGNGINTIEVLMKVVEHFRKDLSSTLPYHLAEGLRGMEDFKIESKESEFRRIFRQHIDTEKSSGFDELENDLVQLLYQEPGKKEPQCHKKKKDSGKSKSDGWEKVVDLLLLARFISGGGAE